MTTTHANPNALAATATIFELLDRFGERVYSDNTSLAEHAKASAVAAKQRGFDRDMIIAAFLHDIGMLLPPGLPSRLGHETMGANYLAELGFNERVVEVVRQHVNAKRYLCTMRMYFFDQLNPQQQRRLIEQGGPMAEREARLFEHHPYFDDLLRLRSLEVSHPASTGEFDSHWMAGLIHQHLSLA